MVCGLVAASLAGFSKNTGVVPINKNLWSLREGTILVKEMEIAVWFNILEKKNFLTCSVIQTGYRSLKLILRLQYL